MEKEKKLIQEENREKPRQEQVRPVEEGIVHEQKKTLEVSQEPLEVSGESENAADNKTLNLQEQIQVPEIKPTIRAQGVNTAIEKVMKLKGSAQDIEEALFEAHEKE